MQTQPRYNFSPDLFKSIREQTPVTDLQRVQNELKQKMNVIRGLKAWNTQLTKKLYNALKNN